MGSKQSAPGILEFPKSTLYIVYFLIWFSIISGIIMGVLTLIGSSAGFGSIILGFIVIGYSAFMLYLEYTNEKIVEKLDGGKIRNPANCWNPLLWEDVDENSTRLEDMRLGQGGHRMLIRIVGGDIDTEVRTVSDNRDLYNLDPDQFEQFVAMLWSRMGYNTKVTDSSADRGIDVFAQNDNEMLVLQAKRYAKKNKVSRPTVQKSYAAGASESADGVVVVTTSSFSNPAIEEAKKLSQDIEITLIDGGDLDKLSSEYL
jgi:hypothetical protein